MIVNKVTPGAKFFLTFSHEKHLFQERNLIVMLGLEGLRVQLVMLLDGGASRLMLWSDSSGL